MIRHHASSARPLIVTVTIVTLRHALTEATHIALPQPECIFIRGRDAKPEKCAAGNGDGENSSH